MKKLLFFFLLITWFTFFLPFPVNADTQNNKFGVHILFPSELDEAARLINSSGGDWGYVTIPIQATDKDLNKWQDFMNEAKRLHIIPIIRLATNGDYFNTKVWEKPKDENILDFANFLNSLEWPTKNRYVIVFNEVNRDDEWGGEANPEEYANILQYAVTSFKSKSPDFFIISSGMDNAAANSDTAVNQYTFFRQMDKAVPGIFNQVDGFSSHSYPNPGFSQPPSTITDKSIYSFKFEKELIDSLSEKDLPVFITETGWSASILPDSVISNYYKIAFENAWSDSCIMAVTPFLLVAGSEPFMQFSLTNTTGETFLRYKTLLDLPKIKGAPVLSEIKKVLGKETGQLTIPIRKFTDEKQKNPQFKREALFTIYNWLLKL